jgi:PIN domain nuclease of toxin-antitoxin system
VSGFLLDTHTLLWWWTEPDRLGHDAREILGEGAARILVSVASVWEIAIKTQSGKLTAIANFSREYGPLMRSNAFKALMITDDHALKAGFLTGAHRDPFDRMIAAQAMIENLTVLTRDPEIAKFGCKVLW